MGPFVLRNVIVVTRIFCIPAVAVLMTAALSTSSVVLLAAEGPGAGAEKEEPRQRATTTTPRIPPAFNAIVPVCYGKNDGKTRFVRPWNVADQSTSTCRPPAPWDQFSVPPNGWSSRLCTTGGSF